MRYGFLSVTVQKWLKSVHTYRSYRKIKTGFLYFQLKGRKRKGKDRAEGKKKAGEEKGKGKGRGKGTGRVRSNP